MSNWILKFETELARDAFMVALRERLPRLYTTAIPGEFLPDLILRDVRPEEEDEVRKIVPLPRFVADQRHDIFPGRKSSGRSAPPARLSEPPGE